MKSNVASLVDDLAGLQAQIALLTAQAQTIKDTLAASGPGKYIGRDFSCTVSVADRVSVPKEVLVAKLERCGVPRAWFARHEVHTSVTTVGKCQPLKEAVARLAGVAA